MKKQHQFGAFGGVFTPCILTILGVIMFMRSNFVVGHAGVLGALAILVLAQIITLLTALSTSAIGTNMRVRGGGAYYLISRVLGADYGGSVGILLFLAQAVSAPFYVLGFTEAVTSSIPPLAGYAPHIAFSTAAVLFVVAYIGASWAIRVQYIVMTILFASILVFMGGAAMRFSPELLQENLAAPVIPATSENPYPFWILFAIYFPAVTGIMAGINMSGDLKDPSASIPKGTLWAIAVGFLVYSTQIMLFGGAFSRDTLIEQPYLTLKDNAVLGMGFLVMLGMFAASLSSALGSMLGAPRVLQAVGRDDILPPLKPFAKGTPQHDEPRRALLATGVLTFGVIAWATLLPNGNALNTVAGLITEFFLCTYGMLNLAAFMEAISGNPSFRPRFRFFHWSTALAGALGCLGVALVINPLMALIAVTVLAALIWYMKQRNLQQRFGDVWWGYLFNKIRHSLLRINSLESSPKNWRPSCLIFSGNPDTRERLVQYGLWMENGRGVIYLAQVLVGDRESYFPRRQGAVERLENFCQERGLPAFPIVTVDDDLGQGMAGVMQTVSSGAMRPNLLMMGWTHEQGMGRVPTDIFHLARDLGMSICLIRPGDENQMMEKRRIDIWWRGMKNGRLMVLLAYLLRNNWAWHDAEVRLLRMIPDEAGKEQTEQDLKALLDIARVPGSVKVLVSQLPYVQILQEESKESDVIFLGMNLPETGSMDAWHAGHAALLCNDSATFIFVEAEGDEGLFS